ncbi:MAG: electron transfer flavoprotein subunit beta/FixA family protein [Armatimonadota bacterium]|nr:electron transfer flavoprotein subunit beta/FixA family protein [Armatimonadota bacterium]
MKILVPIKRVPDPYAKIKVDAAGKGIETNGLKYEINPFDEIAVEEAVRLDEKHGCEIIAVSIGGHECEEQLRKALAMGAHRGIHVETTEALDSLGVAKILKVVVDREVPDIVLMGKQAIDDDANQVGQMLAALCEWPQATFASKVDIDGGRARIERETDGGQETLEMPIPCVITTDLRLNEPRYVALPGIIKARTKPVDKLPLMEIGVAAECRVRTVELHPPKPRAPGQKVSTVDELVQSLKGAGVV